MIYIERTIIINKNEATIEEPIVLYRGDKNIEIQFTIENNPFKYKSGTEATYGQLVIKRPSTGPIFTDSARLSNGRVLFTITDGMIDEEIETGNYDFQIRLINTDQTSRGTLPPVTAGIIIKEPICEEAVAGTTYVNSRRAVIINSDESDEVFGENGDYNRTNWSNGDIITDTRLNKIEEALYEINNNVPNDYATEEYVDNQRRQTETYAERYTDNAISRINLDSYATYTYVDNQRLQTEAAAERYTDNAIGRLNLDNYATHSYVDSEITKLDINKYATQEYVDDAVSNISGGGGNVDLTGYATEAYVDQALTNYPTHKEMKSTVKDYVTASMPDIMEINHSVFTGDEFAIDDYNNYVAKSVLLHNTTIGYETYKHELVHMQLGMDYESSNRTIVVYSPRGYIFSYSITKDGTITCTGVDSFATQDTINSILGKRNYATQDYVNEQIGDINAILDAINGEEV